MQKCKILFLTANPFKNGQNSRLEIDREIHEIQEKIRATPHRDDLEIVSAWWIQPQDWLDQLNERPPHILHFSGHGDKEGQLLCMGKNALGYTIAQPISGQTLKEVFRVMKGDIRLVVLNSCYSKQQAEAIKEEIDCVIGMNDAIHDNAAITFVSAFYSALGYGHSVQHAFDQARVALPLANIAEGHIPELLERTEGIAAKTRLLEPAATEQQDDGSAISIFYCYAPEDKGICLKLEKHLSIMRRQNLIKGFTGYDIKGGEEVDKEQKEIERHLNSARIILLMVSSDLLGSDDLYEKQIKPALDRRKNDENIRVIPILAQPIEEWEQAEFGRYQPLPLNKKPIASWRNIDEALSEVAKGIRRVVEDMRKG